MYNSQYACYSMVTLSADIYCLKFEDVGWEQELVFLSDTQLYISMQEIQQLEMFVYTQLVNISTCGTGILHAPVFTSPRSVRSTYQWISPIGCKIYDSLYSAIPPMKYLHSETMWYYYTQRCNIKGHVNSITNNSHPVYT